MGGAVTGFTKAFKRERPEAMVKAVDLPQSRKTASLADTLIDETLRDPGAIEIGVRDGRRSGVALREFDPIGSEHGVPLGEGTIFAITGAAGSIVSAITENLAGVGGGTFHLLDLVPLPAADDPDVARFESDREGLKRELFERLKAEGERATPVQVEARLAKIERAAAARSAVTAVEHAGGVVFWHAVDLTDGGAVAKVVDQIREESGCIDVLLHAAGFERSRQLPDKPADEWNLIFDVKADGWFNLFKAIGDMPLGAVVFFSSIAGRFGNSGQTDYSSANDLFCKWANHLHDLRPDTLARAIDWTAWADIGMAARGSIPEIMARAGIDMLKPEVGIPVIRRELLRGAPSGEILVGGKLGVLLADLDPTGGVDPEAATGADGRLLAARFAGVAANGAVAFRGTLDPSAQPFLNDHRIDGTAVLPGVMGIEGFAEAARSLFPGLAIRSVENVDFVAPFKFYRDEAREVEIQATAREKGDAVLVDCVLVGRRTLAGQPQPIETVHFRGTVRMGAEGPKKEHVDAPPTPGDRTLAADDVYGVYFHGPAYRVLEKVWTAGDGVAAALAPGLPDDRSPSDAPLETEPRLLELCFQSAGAWEIARTGELGLPTRFARATFYGDGSSDALTAIVTHGETAEHEAYDVDVVDGRGHVRVRLEGYATASLPGAIDDARRAPFLRALASDEDPS
jgi:NAD(P)-dependent dehydrogenase (short-subunit alcohol dehydrogenase family)